MKKVLYVFVIIFLLSVSPGLLEINGESNTGEAMILKNDVSNATPDTVLMQEKSSELQMSKDFGKIPLYFIPNEGQVD